MNIIESMLKFIGMNAVVIVESGESDGMRWTKYSDGTSKCICKGLTAEISPQSNLFGKPLYFYEINFPTGLFIESPAFNGKMETNTVGMMAESDFTTASKARLYTSLDVAAGTAKSFKISFEAEGRWK